MTYLTSLVVLFVLKGSCTQTVRLTVKRVLRGGDEAVKCLIRSSQLYLDFTVCACVHVFLRVVATVQSSSPR